MGDARWEWQVLNDRVNWSPELFEIYGLEHQKIIDAIRKADPSHLEDIVRAHALKNVDKIAALA